MRLAYADPPYLGQCSKYGHKHIPPYNCWDEIGTHQILIELLVSQWPEGWALSSSSPSLRYLLPLCPDDVRVAAWAKSFCAFKKGVRPCYAWEPVIFWRGRNPSSGYKHLPPEKGGKQNTPKDFLIEPITLKKGLTGAKPEKFCRWVLDLLGYLPGDEVTDLFPGTGVMSNVL